MKKNIIYWIASIILFIVFCIFGYVGVVAYVGTTPPDKTYIFISLIVFSVLFFIQVFRKRDAQNKIPKKDFLLYSIISICLIMCNCFFLFFPN